MTQTSIAKPMNFDGEYLNVQPMKSIMRRSSTRFEDQENDANKLDPIGRQISNVSVNSNYVLSLCRNQEEPRMFHFQESIRFILTKKENHQPSHLRATNPNIVVAEMSETSMWKVRQFRFLANLKSLKQSLFRTGS